MDRRETGQEPLPVLEAFQSFLEIERKRTQSRILMLSAVFLVILLTVAGTVAVVGLAFSRQIRADMAGFERSVGAVRDEALKTKGEAEAALARFEAESVRIREELTQAQETREAGKSDLAAQVGGQASEMAKMRESLGALLQENSAFKADLGRLQAGIPAMSNTIHQAIEDVLKGRAGSEAVGPIAKPPPAAPVVAHVTAPPPTRFRDLIIAITPTNSSQAMPWVVPIPE